MKITLNLKILNFLFVLLISMSASSSLSAKPASDYQIEVIVFKNNKNDDTHNEAWTEPKLSIPENAIKLQSSQSNSDTDTDNTSANSSPDTSDDNNYILLSKDQLKYSNIYNKLKYSHRYTPIAHIGWIQSKKDMNNSKPIYFNLGETYEYNSLPTSEIVGLIKFSSKRFIHANVDIVYSTLTKGNQKTNLQRFSINEMRRLKNKEINYFDHPVFAAIVVIHELV